jgi:hypothetical protein
MYVLFETVASKWVHKYSTPEITLWTSDLDQAWVGTVNQAQDWVNSDPFGTLIMHDRMLYSPAQES